MAAYIFFVTLSKCLDDAQSVLGYISSTKLSFRILFPSQEGLWWTEGSCSGEASLPGLPIKRETL